jgi:hypothetical protein
VIFIGKESPKKKPGRPRLENKREHRFEFRVNDEEISKLDYCVEATGKSRTEIIRTGVDIVYNRLRGNSEK